MARWASSWTLEGAAGLDLKTCTRFIWPRAAVAPPAPPLDMTTHATYYIILLLIILALDEMRFGELHLCYSAIGWST